MFRLMPKQQQLFERFERIAEGAVEAAVLLKKLLEAPEKAGELVPKLEAVEHKCDDANHEALAMLQKNMTLPLDRAEAVELLTELDDIVDGADAVAHRLVLYRAKGVRPEAVKLAEVLEQSTVELQKGVKALRTGKDKQAVLKPVVDVNKLENDGDVILRQAIGALFDNEQNAIELIKWKELLEMLEDCTDGCERAANVIEAIVLKHG